MKTNWKGIVWNSCRPKRYEVRLTRVNQFGFEILEDFDSKDDAEYFAQRVREVSQTAKEVWVEDTMKYAP